MLTCEACVAPSARAGSEKKNWGAYQPTLNAVGPVDVGSAESGGLDLAVLRRGVRGKRGRSQRGTSPNSSKGTPPGSPHAGAGEGRGAGASAGTERKGVEKPPEMSKKKKKAFTRALEGYL